MNMREKKEKVNVNLRPMAEDGGFVDRTRPINSSGDRSRRPQRRWNAKRVGVTLIF